MTTNLTPPDISYKALFRLAGPIFVANVSIIGSGTIDTIMGGQLGRDHLAAIALGIAATISVLMGLVGVLQGLSPVAGHHYGARCAAGRPSTCSGPRSLFRARWPHAPSSR